jgi:hypothetical protein
MSSGGEDMSYAEDLAPSQPVAAASASEAITDREPEDASTSSEAAQAARSR